MKRKKIIVKTSIISIVANLFLVIFKAIVGVLSNSIAIISDSINNLSDALSSIVTIVGAKIAGKEPDREHPYGHGRIEYVASFVVSAIVLYAGFTALIESVKKIIKPEIPTYSTITIIVLVVAIFVKLILGTYVKNKGKQVKSSSLVASGADALNDVIISVSVLSSAIIYIVFNLNIESYIGVLVSIAIIKTGIELIRESVNSMVGIRIENKLSKSIKKEIMKEEIYKEEIKKDEIKKEEKETKNENSNNTNFLSSLNDLYNKKLININNNKTIKKLDKSKIQIFD